MNGRKVISTSITDDKLNISSLETRFYMTQVTIDGNKYIKIDYWTTLTLNKKKRALLKALFFTCLLIDHMLHQYHYLLTFLLLL